MPDARDLLNSVVMNGASRSTVSMRRRVGSGSLAHLDGSCNVSDAYRAKRQHRAAGRRNVAAGASAVAERTAAISSSKKRCRSHASTAGDSGIRPIRTSIDSHSWLGVERSASIDLYPPQCLDRVSG